MRFREVSILFSIFVALATIVTASEFDSEEEYGQVDLMERMAKYKGKNPKKFIGGGFRNRRSCKNNNFTRTEVADIFSNNIQKGLDMLKTKMSNITEQELMEKKMALVSSIPELQDCDELCRCVVGPPRNLGKKAGWCAKRFKRNQNFRCMCRVPIKRNKLVKNALEMDPPEFCKVVRAVLPEVVPGVLPEVGTGVPEVLPEVDPVPEVVPEVVTEALPELLPEVVTEALPELLN